MVPQFGHTVLPGSLESFLTAASAAADATMVKTVGENDCYIENAVVVVSDVDTAAILETR